MFDFDATLPVMAVQFLLLAVVLNAVFYKPLTKVIEERSEYIRKNEVGAKERLAKAEELAQQYEKELATSIRQSQEIVASAQAEAQKITSSQIAEALSEAQARREEAAKEIGIKPYELQAITWVTWRRLFLGE